MPVVIQYAFIKNDTMFIQYLNIYICFHCKLFFSAIYIIPNAAKFNYALVSLFFLSTTFQLFHVKIQEVLYTDDNGKLLRTLLLAESFNLSAMKTTPWKELCLGKPFVISTVSTMQ